MFLWANLDVHKKKRLMETHQVAWCPQTFPPFCLTLLPSSDQFPLPSFALQVPGTSQITTHLYLISLSAMQIINKLIHTLAFQSKCFRAVHWHRTRCCEWTDSLSESISYIEHPVMHLADRQAWICLNPTGAASEAPRPLPPMTMAHWGFQLKPGLGHREFNVKSNHQEIRAPILTHPLEIYWKSDWKKTKTSEESM